jgi:hypothetical protein
MDPNQYQQPQYPQQAYPPTGYEQPPAYQQTPGYEQPAPSYAPPSTPAYQPTPGYDPNYAYQANPYGAYAAPMPPKTSGMAIASLVLSLLGLVILPLIGPVLGVIFGHMALGEIKRSNGMVEGQGLAVAGLVTGYVLLGLTLIGCCLFALSIGLLNSATPSSFIPHL